MFSLTFIDLKLAILNCLIWKIHLLPFVFHLQRFLQIKCNFKFSFKASVGITLANKISTLSKIKTIFNAVKTNWNQKIQFLLHKILRAVFKNIGFIQILMLSMYETRGSVPDSSKDCLYRKSKLRKLLALELGVNLHYVFKLVLTSIPSSQETVGAIFFSRG